MELLTFAVSREVDIQDGLEKMGADFWDAEGCERPLLIDLRRDFADMSSGIFFSVGGTMEKSASGAQERLLVYIASQLAASLVQFLDTNLEMASYLFDCPYRPEMSDSKYLLERFQTLERKVLAFCDLIDSSIEVSESTIHLRQHPVVIPTKRGTLKSARRTFKDCWTSDFFSKRNSLNQVDSVFEIQENSVLKI